MCNEWRDSYIAFKTWALSNGYDVSLSIDRIDNDGNYEPNNCQWANKTEQSRNRRNVQPITAFGETKYAIEWIMDARCPHTHQTTIQKRLAKGMTPEQAITDPGPAKNDTCKKGHRYTQQNTAINVNGARVCRICAHERTRRSRRKQKTTG